MKSLSLSLFIFLALPAPLKIAAVMVGGLFFTGMKVRHQGVEVHRHQPMEAPAERNAEPKLVTPAVPAQKAVPALKPLEVTVNSDGAYQLDGKKLTEAQLVKELKSTAKATPQRRLVIKADALTPYQMVVNAVKLSKGAGLTNVSFASKPASP